MDYASEMLTRRWEVTRCLMTELARRCYSVEAPLWRKTYIKIFPEMPGQNGPGNLMFRDSPVLLDENFQELFSGEGGQ